MLIIPPAARDLCEIAWRCFAAEFPLVPGRIPFALHAPGKAAQRSARILNDPFLDAWNGAKRSGRQSGTQRKNSPRSSAELHLSQRPPFGRGGAPDHQVLCTRTPSTGGGIVRPVRATREEAMTDITRRTVLSAAAAAGALGRRARSPAKAAAPPAGKQAPGLLPLQGRRHRGHGRDRRRQHLPASGPLRPQRARRTRSARRSPRPPRQGQAHRPLFADRREHGRQARGHRHRAGRGGFRAHQRRRRPVPAQPRGRRPRPERRRHRGDLAFPRRPRERPPDGRQQAGFPERRDPGPASNGLSGRTTAR